MKKILYIAIVLIVAGLLGFVVLRVQNKNLTNIANQKVLDKKRNDNSSVKIVPPSPTPEVCKALTFKSPKNGAKVTSPLTVKVIVDNTKSCKWIVFEGQAGKIVLRDRDGKTLGSGILATSDVWTVPTPIMYIAQITFSKPVFDTGMLEITEENPSGKKNPQIVTLPIAF